jgi:general secretion pathway protein C
VPLVALRQQRWVVPGITLGFVTALACTASDSTFLRAGAALGRNAIGVGHPGVETVEAQSDVSDLEAIARRNSSGSAMPAEMPASTPARGDKASEAPAVPALNLVVRGTWIVHDTVTGARRAWTVIEDVSTQTQGVYRVGDPLPGGDAEVAEILRRAVRVRRGGRFELLAVSVGRGGRPGPIAGTSSLPAPGTDQIRQIGPGRFAIGQKYLEARLSNVEELLAAAHAIPVEGQGFRIRRIRRGSLFEQVGLQNGDLLRRINGIELTSFEAAMQAFELLRAEARVTLELVRDGASQSLDYEIR